MIHTIISWDCCFRNFFHLIGSLAEQDYPKDRYEFIFVEQCSREESDAYNHRLGLKSLQDTVDEYCDRYNVRALFLSQSHRPYHLGICNNTGIREAKGTYISVMDGDLLLPPDFLLRLEEAHATLKTIVNLDRRYAARPVNATLKNWTEGAIDFHRCLAECPDRDRPIPQQVDNKGPLISAPKEWWEAVGGYDEHRIWSTGVSRLGQDITARLELYASCESLALPDRFCVHPYHPAGFDRDAKLESLILHIQQELINAARSKQEFHHLQRKGLTAALYNKYQWAIESNISGKFDLTDTIKLNLHPLFLKQRSRKFASKCKRMLVPQVTRNVNVF